ncbi:MAG: MFS transporter [Congregibacter sp.]
MSEPPLEAAHRSAFSQRRYRIYFPTSCLSTLAAWVVRFLFGWVAWELTGSAFWVGSVASLMLIPTFLLSPLFGITADRINPRDGLLVTMALQGVVAGLAAGVAALDALALPALAALALGFGAVTAAHTPIRLALIPRLVERAALPSAIGYSAVIFNSSRIIGPAIGAAFLQVASITATFAGASLIFALATLNLARVKGTARKLSAAHRGSFLQQLRGGFRYLRNAQDIQLVFLLTLASGALGRTAIELLPAISGQLLGGDATALATLTAAAGGGSIVGGVIVSQQSGRLQRLLQLVLVGIGLAAMTLLSALAWYDIWTIALAIAMVSLCTTMVGTGCQALSQLIVSEEYRGRVMSLWVVVAMGTPAFGAVLVGSLADSFGFATAFAVPASIAIVLVIVVLVRMRGGRVEFTR